MRQRGVPEHDRRILAGRADAHHPAGAAALERARQVAPPGGHAYEALGYAGAAEGTDADGDALSSSWSWTVNDKPVAGAESTFSASSLAAGDVVQCHAVMSDGTSMYTGSFSRHAVRISRSISLAALRGVSRACAAVTDA